MPPVPPVPTSMLKIGIRKIKFDGFEKKQVFDSPGA